MAEALARTSLLSELIELLDVYRPHRVVESLNRQTLWAFFMHADVTKLEAFVTIAKVSMPAFIELCDSQLRAIKGCKCFFIS
jgi:hypothetical protein